MTLSAEDRLEILDLFARRAQLFDAGEAEGWAGLFTPDARLSIRPGPGIPAVETGGHADLVALARKHYDEMYTKRGIRHEVFNVVIESTETGARVMSYLMMLRVGDGQPAQLVATGRYVDELARGAEGWRFTSRTLFPDT